MRGFCAAWVCFISCPAIAELPATITLRGSLMRSKMSFEHNGKGHVAFLGGSITEMNGYRPHVMNFLRKEFGKVKFEFTNAGISSTCSTTGAHRLHRDILSKGRLDLIFVEYAVNDDQDAAHKQRECIRGMEGVVRQIREKQPNADVVVIHFVNPPMLKAIQAGKSRTSRPAHESVAKHYAVPTIDIAAEVAARIKSKSMTWKEYGGTHPGRKGNRFAADRVIELLNHAWKAPARTLAMRALPKPMDTGSYHGGRFLSPNSAQRGKGWRWEQPNWRAIGGGFRKRFGGRKLLVAEKPAAASTMTFTGRGIGLYVLAGPDAGTVEASIDGGKFRSFDLYHRFSRGLHYPRTVMLFTDLQPGEHTLRIRVSKNRNAASKGNAVRILEFAVH